MKDSAYQVKRTEKKGAAQERLISLVANGMTIKAALKQVGRVYATYEQWRTEDKIFARAVDSARLGNRDRRLGNIDFVTFREMFFKMDTPWHHFKMIEAIEGAEGDSVTMILAPPEHGKTTLMEDYICWKLAMNPNFRICVISEGQDHARKIVGRIQQRMTDPLTAPGFIASYGPFKAGDREDSRKPWNADFMTLVKANNDERDYSLEARGIGSRIYGSRYDLIILDDVQSDINLSQSQKILERFRFTILSRPGPEGRVIIVGTRCGPGDFYEICMAEEDLIDNYVAMPAMDYKDNPLWPERWPGDKLQRRKKKVGEEMWNRAYMQRSGDESKSTFTPGMIERCYDKQRSVLDPAPGVDVIFGVDPALGGVAALVACAYSADRLWVLDVDTIEGLARNEELFDFIARFAGVWRPSTCIFEVDGLGKGLHDDDRLRILAATRGFNVVPHETRRRKSDPAWGVGAMASSFSAAEILIPWKDEESHRRMLPLVEELKRWRPNLTSNVLRQDMVMSLWFCWRWWVTNRRLIGSVRKQPWRPTWLKEDAKMAALVRHR